MASPSRSPRPPVDRMGYARHGRDCCGVQVPCRSLVVSRSSAYQSITLIDKVRGEGNCGRVTDRGKEAGAKAARLRTETSYEAGEVRRVSPSSRSRTQTTAQIKGELVQRNIFYPGRAAALRPRLDGLLRASVAAETIRQARPVDSPPPTDVLLEALAVPPHAPPGANPSRCSASPSDPTRSQPQRPLAHRQNHRQLPDVSGHVGSGQTAFPPRE